MLADELDYVIGVDPHRDTHALAVVDVRTGGVVFEATTVADGEGYACVLRLADQHASGRRVFAVEGTVGSDASVRATRSTRSGPLAASSARRGQHGRVPAASEKRCGH
jgi:hypothetical protein